jgi:N-methylhydantoinase A/oxoprolinase/acetone carboxylase beta subunit
VNSIGTKEDLDQLLEAFEDLYCRMFTTAARREMPAYHVSEVCVVAKVDTVKPKLRKHELSPKAPDADARKGVRQVFQQSKWQEADIWEMEKLKPGNEIDGLAIIEASNTTLFVPPEWHVRIDEHDIYWLERKTAQ